MYQPWIFATTLAAGGSLVAYAVTTGPGDNNPPETASPPAAAVHVIPPPAPAPIAEPTASDPVLELQPVVIMAPRRHAAPSTPAPDVTADRPCSNWRDLGPTHVMAGQPSGDLQVRALCP